MPSTFPGTLDTFATNHQDSVGEIIHAALLNDLADAVNKTEREVRVVATFVVASSTSRRKPLADYACTGTNDHTTINSALTAAAAVTGGGGRVVLLEGTYTLGGSVVIPNAFIQLLGQGKNTVLRAGSGQTAPILVVTGPSGPGVYGVNLQSVEKLTIDGAVGTGAAAHGLELRGCVYQGAFQHLHITGCKGHSVYLHSANQTQQLGEFGPPMAGTFTASYSGQTTAGIAYNASASTVQTALAGLSTIGSGNVTCTGGPLPGTAITITLTVAGADTGPSILVDGTGLTGGGVFCNGGERPAYNKVTLCNIENGSRDGIRNGDVYPAGTYAEHNEFYHNSITFHGGGAGIFTTGNNCRIHSNQFDWLDQGIHLEGCENNAVWGNTFDRCFTNDLYVTQGGLHTFGFNLLGDRPNFAWLAGSHQVYLTGGTSGNKFVGNSSLKTGNVQPSSGTPGTGWQYSYGEGSDVGQSGSPYWGPNIYIGNAFSWMPTDFTGARPVLFGNSSSSMSVAVPGMGVRNTGTASIAAAASSATVTHGLGLTPVRVQLTPTADTQGRRYWVSAKGATTFTITLDAAAATNPITFDWQAASSEG